MTVTYCTANDVVGLLRLVDNDDQRARLIPDATTDPSLTEIEARINEAEDYIDSQTNHSWRSTLVTGEMHDYTWRWDRYIESEYPVILRNRAIKTFDKTTDKIEIYTGAAWVDLLDPVNGFTADRTHDYWIDYANSTIYLVNQKPRRGSAVVRVTYRYGETTVPGDIKHAAEKYAALRIMESDFYRMTAPQGQGLYDPRPRILEKWDDDNERIISRRRELKAVVV